MSKGQCDIYRVARQCGVVLIDAHKHSPMSRKPFQCFCKPTVRYIGQQHGEEHLRLVFRLMTGTKTNAAELYADMITAVSHILVKIPEMERRPDLITKFDSIDLGAMRQKVKAMRLGFENWKHLASLLALELYQPSQGNLLDVGEMA